MRSRGFVPTSLEAQYSRHCRWAASIAWTPESFAQTHGAQTVRMLKSNCWPSERVSLARFFEELANRDEDRGHAVELKVRKLSHLIVDAEDHQDWPPSSFLKQQFEQNHDTSMRAVPMPAYTRYDGIRSLIAHYAIPIYPFKSQQPDMGMANHTFVEPTYYC